MSTETQLTGDITVLLRRWSDGDQDVIGDLIEVAYRELRTMAAAYLRRESREHTLQATALVNEFYMRLARQRSAHLIDRRHFYSFAAMLMRRILTDYARQNYAQKRLGTAGVRIPLHPDLAWIDVAGEDALSLDEALSELEAIEERKVRIIELRYFLGCTSQETAEMLGIGRTTVERDLQFAKAWLYRRLHPEQQPAKAEVGRRTLE
jgi:RNA polymerase sigma factor (TIGR02999 family)